MKTRVLTGLGVLALLLARLVPVATGQAPAPTDIAAVDAFIDAPRVLFGRTRAAVEQTLGHPVSVHARTMTGGRRAPTDPVDELTYPGVVLAVSRGAAGLRRVEITEPRWALPGDLNVGAPRRLVEQRLGEPQVSTDVSVLYLYSDGYPNTVEFYLRGGRVQRIEWLYAPAD